MEPYDFHMEPKPLTSRLVDVINQQIQASNLSVTEMIEKTGIPKVTLHRRLRTGHGLTIAELESLADQLNTTPAALMTQAEATN